MSNKESNIEKTNFDAFIQAVGSEIEQAQVRLIVAANAQMLFHYWKIGNYILYFLAVIEFCTADHRIRNTVSHELFFQNTRLRIRPE